MHKLRLIAIIFLTFGVCLISAILVFGRTNKSAQMKQIENYQSTVSSVDLSKAEKYNDTLRGFNYDADLMSEYDELPTDASEVMAIIKIKKVSIQLPVYHGTSDAVLMAGIGHVEGTSLPIGQDNTKSVLTGHNGVPGVDMLFTRLDEMEKGDRFTIQLGSTDYVYKVNKIQVMTPDDAELYSYTRPTGKKAEVVLITCTPYGFNTDRLLVIGHLEKIKKTNPNEKTAISLGKESKVSYTILAAGLLGLIVIVIDAKIRK